MIDNRYVCRVGGAAVALPPPQETHRAAVTESTCISSASGSSVARCVNPCGGGARAGALHSACAPPPSHCHRHRSTSCSLLRCPANMYSRRCTCGQADHWTVTLHYYIQMFHINFRVLNLFFILFDDHGTIIYQLYIYLTFTIC